MRQTPGQMHMHDMVTVATIVFEIIEGGGLLKPSPPHRIANFLKYPGSDRDETDTWNTQGSYAVIKRHKNDNSNFMAIKMDLF